MEERKHQVAVMGQVHTKAEKVFAWLGSGYEAVVKALSGIDRYRDSLDFFVQNLHELIAKEYRSGIWVIQEFVLGREFEIWSGAYKIDGYQQSPLFLRYTKSNTSPFSPTILPILFVPTILSNSILSHLLKTTLTPASTLLVSPLSTLFATIPSTSS